MTLIMVAKQLGLILRNLNLFLKEDIINRDKLDQSYKELEILRKVLSNQEDNPIAKNMLTIIDDSLKNVLFKKEDIIKEKIVFKESEKQLISEKNLLAKEIDKSSDGLDKDIFDEDQDLMTGIDLLKEEDLSKLPLNKEQVKTSEDGDIREDIAEHSREKSGDELTVSIETRPVLERFSSLDLYPNQMEIQQFILEARKDINALSLIELKKGLQMALAQGKYIDKSEDKTTLLTIAERVARSYIQSGKFEKAMQIRMQAAQAILPAGPLGNLDVELQKEHPKFGLKLQPIDTSLFKNHALSVQRQPYTDGTTRLHVEGSLSHPVREELQKTLLEIDKSTKQFFEALPKGFCEDVTITEEEAVFFGRQEKAGKRFEGGFSTDVEKHGFKIEANNWRDPKNKLISKVKVIHFKGVGTVRIGISPEFHSQYNRIQIDLDHGISEKEMAGKLNIIFASLGLGPASSSAREEDVERIKIMQLFRAFYPKRPISLKERRLLLKNPFKVFNNGSSVKFLIWLINSKMI